MKNFHNIEFELIDQIGTLWLNRPDKHNAMNAEMISDIIECVESVNNMTDVRVLLLKGRGKSFCAGADLNYMKGIAEFGFKENYEDSLKLAKCFNAIYNCEKPTMAVVQGAAIGGANGLLAACDFVYCTEDAKFAFSEVKLGIAPATISPYVIKRIGEFRAKDLMLSGRRFTGIEAAQYQLANSAHPVEEIEEVTQKMIKLLLTSGPRAMAACKKLICNICNKYDFEESINYSANLIAELRASEEGQEGMASFLDKRKPNWVKY